MKLKKLFWKLFCKPYCVIFTSEGDYQLIYQYRNEPYIPYLYCRLNQRYKTLEQAEDAIEAYFKE